MKIRFSPSDLPEVTNIIRSYIKPGKNYIIELSEKVNPDHLAFFHSVIVKAFMESTGYSKRKAIKILCDGFLTIEQDGKRIVRHLSELSTTEMAKFCEDCRMWLYHQFGTVIPDKGSKYIDELMEKLEKL